MFRPTSLTIASRARMLLSACLLGTAAITCALPLNGHSAAHAASAGPQPDYSALRSVAPSGLTLVSTAAEAKQAAGPVWFSQAEGPNILTARGTPVSVPGLSVWVARAQDGGICVLALRAGQPGVAGPGASCAPAGGSSGATLESPASSADPGYIVGVAPDGVSAVSILQADGTTQTTSVQDNAYAATLKGPVARVTFTAPASSTPRRWEASNDPASHSYYAGPVNTRQVRRLWRS
jgi:hypothetical protein